MGYSRKPLQSVGFDEVDWQHYYHRRQQSYIRLKLQRIKLYWEGQSVQAIAKELHLSSKSIGLYLGQYIAWGLAGLAQPTRRPQPSALSLEQRAAFKTTLLTSCPQDQGLEGRIWTGHQMKQYLKNTYQVDYKSGIYDLLEGLNLSHQKAHADYANADVVQQKAFLVIFTDTLLVADEKTAVVAFDEFSVSEKPTAAYGWAEKNTRPTFKTDEKKGTALMDS